jgi:hypothetical protein
VGSAPADADVLTDDGVLVRHALVDEPAHGGLALGVAVGVGRLDGTREDLAGPLVVGEGVGQIATVGLGVDVRLEASGRSATNRRAVSSMASDSSRIQASSLAARRATPCRTATVMSRTTRAAGSVTNGATLLESSAHAASISWGEVGWEIIGHRSGRLR